jgi:hypothetical protein
MEQFESSLSEEPDTSHSLSADCCQSCRVPCKTYDIPSPSQSITPRFFELWIV